MKSIKKTLPLSCSLLLLCCCMLHQVRPCCAEERPDQFIGETLQYAIEFWLFHDAAQGELCFSKIPGGYRAYFQARTTGFMKALAGQRTETMESIMEFDPALQRLRPRIFKETYLQQKKFFQRTVVFDYERGFYTCTREAPGTAARVTKAALPGTLFEDLLTLYYNFRMGCYGPLRDSGKLRVPVIMKEKPSLIGIEYTAPQSKERSRGFPAVLTMERDLTHAFSRRVLAGINPSGILEKALIVDAYLFGDLAVRLNRINYIPH